MVKKSILAKVGDKINYKLIRDGYKTGKGNVVVTAEMDTKTTVVADVPSTAYASNLDYEVDISGENPPIINIKNDITCPDDTIISKGKYLFYDIGQEYKIKGNTDVVAENFNKVGNITVDNNIASNFSASNYIRGNYNIPSKMSDWELVVAFTLTSTTQGCLISSYEYNGFGDIYINGGNQIRIWLSGDGSSYNIFSDKTISYPMTLNKKYYLKWSYTNGIYSLDMSEDGKLYTNYLTMQSSTVMYGNNYIIFGVDYGTGSDIGTPFQGSIDLKDTYLKSNDKVVWEAVETGEYIQGIKDFTLNDNGNELTTKLFDYHYREEVSSQDKANLYINSEKDNDLYYKKDELQLNVSKIGSTIINENGIASNFGNNSYVTFGKLNAGDNPWEMVFKVKYKEHSGFQRFCGPSSVNLRNLLITVSDEDKLSLYISTNGSDWNISRNDSKTTLINNTTYYIKALFNGTNYILSLSTDGINYNEEINEASTTPMYNGVSTDFQIGCAFSDESQYNWQGTIDLKKSYIQIGTNEKKYFAENIKKRYDIPSLYSEFVDNITIPAHALYDYVNGEWKLSSTSPFITQDITVNADNAEITMKEIIE